jgi:fatty acid desaturase
VSAGSTDPTLETHQKPGWPWTAVGGLLRDERDLVFVRLAFGLSVLLIPMAVTIVVSASLRWWVAPLYWVAVLWFLGPFVLMLHNTSHRVLFKHRYRVLNHYIPWMVGPCFGMSPQTYFAHHVGMHHQEENDTADLSSTLRYQRDSFVDFVRYYLSFLFGYRAITRYFVRTGRGRMAMRFWVGEVAYVALAGGVAVWSWEAALAVFVGPFYFTRFALMSGNWAQHAFLDPTDPQNPYRSITTFVDSPYNHRCFNDGYHLGHHLKPSRHWLEMPADFQANRERIAAEGAIVFRKIDYFVIWFLLMTKRYHTLARFWVHVGDGPAPSVEERVGILRERTRRVVPEAAEELVQRAA